MRITKKPYQLKFSRSSNLLIINCCLGGMKKGQFFHGNLLVDTGESFTMIKPEILKYLGYDLNNPVKYENITGLEGKLIKLPVITLSWFNCAGKSLNNFYILAGNFRNNLGCNGILGMNFLKENKALISVDKSQIYLL
jgi:hypothetical protein